MKKIIFVIFLTFILRYLGFADDGFMGGSIGGNVYLSKSDSIQMVKEVVNVKMYREYCKVNCRFWFVNNGNTVLDTIGFPDFLYSHIYKSKPLKNFKTFINSKIVKTEQKKEIFNKDSLFQFTRSWYTWTCLFSKNDTVIIDNTYTASWGTSPFGFIEFEYVLGTATSWKGPIKEGTIILNYENVASKLFTSLKPHNENQKEEFKITEANDILTINFKDYLPEQREEIHFMVYSYWVYPYPIDKSNPSAKTVNGLKYLIKIPMNELLKEEVSVQDLINEIYAREGYVFPNKKLTEYYKSKKWYRPD
jgi:hypothetical protein